MFDFPILLLMSSITMKYWIFSYAFAYIYHNYMISIKQHSLKRYAFLDPLNMDWSNERMPWSKFGLHMMSLLSDVNSSEDSVSFSSNLSYLLLLSQEFELYGHGKFYKYSCKIEPSICFENCLDLFYAEWPEKLPQEIWRWFQSVRFRLLVILCSLRRRHHL